MAAGLVGAIGLGLGAAGDIATGLLNYSQSKKDYELQKKNLEYQKSLQQQIFQREDTSIQRRVEDLRAAGLSPVLAAGQGAGTGGTISTVAPVTPKLGSDVAGAGSKLADAAQMYLSLTQQKANLAQTDAQKALLEAQAKKANLDASAVAHDLTLATQTGTRYNSGSGFASQIKDLFGLANSNTVKQAAESVLNKVPKLEKDERVTDKIWQAIFGK